MKTVIDMDETLVKAAMEISGAATKKALVNMALAEYVNRNKQRNILKYCGTKIWDDGPWTIRDSK